MAAAARGNTQKLPAQIRGGGDMGGASRVVSSYLDKFEDGEDGRALLGVDAAQDAVELRVEAAVPQSQQEAAQQRDGHAGDTDTLVHTREAPPPLPWAEGGGDKNKLPGGQIRLPLGGGAEDDGRVVGRVEEDQVEGHEVDHHPQEDHRGAAEPVVLAQQPEQTPTWNQQRVGERRCPSPPATPARPPQGCRLTQDFPDAHHDPGDADQAFSRRSKLRGGADAGPVDTAVEGQLQAWGGRGQAHTSVFTARTRGRTHLPLYAMQGLSSTMVLSLSSRLMVPGGKPEDSLRPYRTRGWRNVRPDRKSSLSSGR